MTAYLWFILLLVVLCDCKQKKEPLTSEVFKTETPHTLDSNCLHNNELVKIVLNNVHLIRYSKMRNVRDRFDSIHIVFSQDYRCLIPPYTQNGDTLNILKKSSPLDRTEFPIYEFKTLNFFGDSAYVHLEFDLTGAISFGSFLRRNEQWVPDSNFVVGVR